MFCDFHNDYLTYSGRKPSLSSICKKLNKCIFAGFYNGKNKVKLLKILKNFLLTKPDNAYLGLENIDYFTPQNSFKLLSLKPFYCSLTWNHTNSLAGGALGLGGLTSKGKEAIKVLLNNNVYIDTAHLNEESFFQVFDYTDKVLCSHTCFNDIYKHKRNISMTQIQKIIDINGLIGLTFVSDFMSNKYTTVDTVVKQIDYFVQRFGDNNLAIGTDFFGTRHLPHGLTNYSNLNNLKSALLNKGYTLTSIDKITNSNLSHFIENHKNIL